MKSPKHETAYRWYILTLAALTHTFSVAMPLMCLPVLFKEISDDLGLSLLQIGMVWGISSLPSIFISLAGGAIGDRFGPRQTLSVVCLLVGIAGALRGFSSDFFTFGLTILLFGILRPIIPMTVHKTCGVWFSHRQLGFANGIVSMGMALGFMMGSMVSATLLSPLLGGWRNVLFFYGGISIVISILWHFTRPEPEDDSAKTSANKPNRSFYRTITDVTRLKNVWLLGCALLGIGACIQGTLGYLPLYLRTLGWSVTSADGASATFHGVSMLCVIPLTLWSDRHGSRKKVLLAATLMIITGVSLLSFVDGWMVWMAVILAGCVRDGFMAVFMTMIIEIQGVGAANAGTAIGLVISLLGIGSVLAPPLGNSLAKIAPGLPFVFWAALAALGGICLHVKKEKNGLPEETNLQANN